jgi:hypothetical protein
LRHRLGCTNMGTITEHMKQTDVIDEIRFPDSQRGWHSA